MLSEKNIINNDDQDSPGDRLNKILDQAGFKLGRGRTSEFHSFLESKTEDWQLSLSAVRSWFGKTSPPMKKIVPIIELLETHYGFKDNCSLKQIEAWWKVGGQDPFAEIELKDQKEPEDENVRKLEFLLPSIILDQVGDDFSKLSSVDLEAIKDFTIDFLVAFSNENIKNCPDEYIKMAISHMHHKLIK